MSANIIALKPGLKHFVLCGVHDRVSSLKDVVSDLDGDFKAVLARLDSVERSLTDHEARDAADFKALSDKVDKIMEIIVEMLKDAQ